MGKLIELKVLQGDKSMIGLSVSFCVRDIVVGKMALDQVEKIVAGTKLPDVEAWERCIKMYRESYWRENPDQCEQTLRQLLAEGKIYQPALDPENGRRPHLATDKGIIHWVNAESEIKWC